MGERMRYRVLGPIEVVDDEPEGRVSVAVGGPQQRRLLGVLLTYPDRVVSTDHLVEALWPDADPPSGANRSVLTYVSRLRASLGRDVIVSQDNGYRLDRTAGTRDIDAFETLITEAERSLPDRAVACYDEALALMPAAARSVSSGSSGGRWPSRPGSPSCGWSPGRNAPRADGDRPPWAGRARPGRA